jgi:hypothetical protein
VGKSLAIFLLACSACNAQGILSGILNPVSGVLSLPTGWTYVQDNSYECQTNSATCVSPSATTGNQILPTDALSVRMFFIIGGDSSFTITSVSGDSGTWSYPAGGQYHNSGHDNVAVACGSGGSSGVTAFTTVTSSTPASPSGISPSSFYQVIYVELSPPVGYAGSCGSANVAHSTGCTTCTGATVSITGTGAAVQIVDYNSGGVTPGATHLWNQWGANYITDFDAAGGSEVGNGVALNVSAGTLAAPSVTFSGSTFATFSVMSVTSTAATFTVPAPNFAIAQYTPNYSSATFTGASTTITLPASTTIGNAAVIIAEANTPNTAATYISSLSGACTWTIPTQFQGNDGGTAGALSMAWCVITSAVGTVNVTMNHANSNGTGVAYTEFSRTSGSWSLVTPAYTSNSANCSPSGQALTLGGTNSIMIQAAIMSGGISNITLYPQIFTPFISVSNNFSLSMSVLLNTTNGAAPTYFFPQSSCLGSAVAAAALQ